MRDNILEELKEFFQNYKGKKTAVYGLGAETEKVLSELDGYLEIFGLLDGFQEQGMLYGKPVLSLSEAVKEQVVLIIAAARPASCRVIAERVRETCIKNKIDLIDIRGRNLLLSNNITYDLKQIKGITKKEFIDEIDRAEIVSFDLFDTLIMRQTLISEDVCEYVDLKLKERGIEIEDFCKKRLKIEKELSRYSAPSILEIYQNLFAHEKEKRITAKEAADLEWQIDAALIIPRREVIALLQYANTKGKEIYFISDSYYSKKKLLILMKKCGITGLENVISSSDYKKSKTQGLFGFLKEKIGKKKWLHIGDDPITDEACVKKEKGRVCRLYSSFDLFESVGYLGMREYLDSLSARFKIGMFIACIFNNPFQFETIDKKIYVEDAGTVAYLFCAPIITDFMFWFQKNIQTYHLKNIWFCARDGYFIQKLYHKLVPKQTSIYFLTSRTAAIRAGVESEQDIETIDKMKFSGSVEENLKERFGILPKNNLDRQTEQDGLQAYKAVILKSAKKARRNYKTYINKLHIQKGEIAFFDFVAKGTVQMYVQRLINYHLKGFYFLRLESEQTEEKNLDIQAFYTKEKKEGTIIFDCYYILETLLTSPFPSVQQFNKKGKPIYAKETRTEQQMRCLQKMQNGVWEYFKTYLALCPVTQRMEQKELDETFLSFIHKFCITDEDFLHMVIEDPFFNRMTKVTEVL